MRKIHAVSPKVPFKLCYSRHQKLLGFYKVHQGNLMNTN